uniref:Uncharacterized protein n=1 Tax=Anguilla anguilla TaxID=7936 RepID=A0A0E9VIV1_ANGAN
MIIGPSNDQDLKQHSCHLLMYISQYFYTFYLENGKTNINNKSFNTLCLSYKIISAEKSSPHSPNIL